MESEHEETQVTSRNENSAKARPTKTLDLEQGEKHHPILVSFYKRNDAK